MLILDWGGRDIPPDQEIIPQCNFNSTSQAISTFSNKRHTQFPDLKENYFWEGTDVIIGVVKTIRITITHFTTEIIFIYSQSILASCIYAGQTSTFPMLCSACAINDLLPFHYQYSSRHGNLHLLNLLLSNEWKK